MKAAGATTLTAAQVVLDHGSQAGAAPTTASGSLSYTLDAYHGSYGTYYALTVTATAAAKGDDADGVWSETITNTDTFNSFTLVRSGSGSTVSSYTNIEQPYSNGSASQPVSGFTDELDSYKVSYNYNSASSSPALVESSGSENYSYLGGGSASGSSTWKENEYGGTSDSYDIKNYLAYSGGGWTMSSGSMSTSGDGGDYQSQSASGPFSSSGSAPATTGSGGTGGTAGVTLSASGSMSGTSNQSGMDESSYTYQTQASWTSAASGWGTATGAKTASADGWSNSYFNVSGSGNASMSASAGGGAGGGASPFGLAQSNVQSSGSGRQYESGSDYSAYSDSGTYTLDASGNWQGSGGSGWTAGHGFTASSFSASGGYSYNYTLPPTASGAGTVGSASATGSASGTFSQSGSAGTSYNYAADLTLSSGGWTPASGGTQTTSSFNGNSQSTSGSGSFNVPVNAGGWTFSGTATESAGQSSYNEQSAEFTSDASGNWNQTSGAGGGNSDSSASAGQSGTYSHTVSGVLLAGSFSQSASTDDSIPSYSVGGSVNGSGIWVPSGSQSEIVSSSNSYSFSGSGSATGNLSAGVPALAGSGWLSTGTQKESQSGSGSVSHTTNYTLSSGGAWQGTSGSGTTTGNQTTFAGYSGGGGYGQFGGDDASGGDVLGTFTQSQGNTVSFNFNTNDSYTPAVAPSGSGASFNPGMPGYWSASSGSGSTSDSGTSAFTYLGVGAYTDGASGSGTLSQAGGGNESFGYTKNYQISSGAWTVGGASGSGSGGASGSGWTNATYTSGSAQSYTSTLPDFAASAVGLGYESSELEGTDQPGGTNDTSYSLQTNATFNGVDWSETGEKTAISEGSVTDTFSASAAAARLHGTPDFPGQLAHVRDLSIANGTAGVSGTSSTYFHETQCSFLDDNGVWQAASSPSSDSSWFGASGTSSWSASGSGSIAPTTDNGNFSGSMSVSGSGTDSYDYKQFYSYSLATGLWTPTGSGSGTASGSGSASMSYSGGTPYSTPLPGLAASAVGLAAPDYETPWGDAGSFGTQLSGSDQQSGSNGISYNYQTNATYDDTDGWTQTGSATVSRSGAASDTFSASASGLSFSTPLQVGGIAGGSASVTGTSNTSYSFTQRADLADGAWQSASSLSSDDNFFAASGATNWSISGSGGVSTSFYNQSASGTASASGSGTESYGYTENYSYSPTTGYWSGIGGTGSASGGGSVTFGYSGRQRSSRTIDGWATWTDQSQAPRSASPREPAPGAAACRGPVRPP